MVDESETSTGPSARKNHPIIVASGMLACALFILGAPRIFLTLFPPLFLPSSEYYHDHVTMGYVVSFFTWFLFLAVSPMWICGDNTKVDIRSSGVSAEKRAIGACIFVPLFMAVLAFEAIIFTWPMANAVLWGEHVALPYVVKGTFTGSTKGCPPGQISLEAMPFSGGHVCRVSEDFLEQLEPGMRIVVEGHGTRYGLFYDSVRLAPSAPTGHAAPGGTWTPDGFGAFTGPVLDLPGSGRR